MNLWQSDIFSSQIEILNFIIVSTGSSITLYDILSVDCRIYIILKSPFFPQLTSILESLLKSKSTIYKCYNLSLYDAIFYSVLHTPYIIFCGQPTSVLESLVLFCGNLQFRNVPWLYDTIFIILFCSTHPFLSLLCMNHQHLTNCVFVGLNQHITF